ncbi:MAG: Ig-like domain-containing protein [Bradymonadales bacterium]|nr:Ig-like domain-containing protein [Bradymonadales bacterium]
MDRRAGQGRWSDVEEGRLWRRGIGGVLAVLVVGIWVAVALGCGDDLQVPGPSDMAFDRAGDLPVDRAGVEDAPNPDATDAPVDPSSDLPADPEPFEFRTDIDPERTECPSAPVDLPQVAITGEGRFKSITGLTYGDLRVHDITIYLPESYESQTDRRYPVLYMHDGQNLFHDNQAAFGVAWEVDDTLDALVTAGAVEEHIVVGIHNNNDRIDEYTPDVDPEYQEGGKGDLYADFLVEMVKPIVDDNFRTLCGRQNTALAGSSLGGLISLHIFMRYPEIFGEVGCVSSSFWWNGGALLDAFESYNGPLPRRLWIDGGSAEGSRDDQGVSSVINDNRRARSIARDLGMTMGDDLGYLEAPGALHNEQAWSARLSSILGFLLSDEILGEAVPTSLSLFLYSPEVADSGRRQRTSVAVEALHDGVRLTWPNEVITFTSLQPGIATVSADGTVQGVAQGTATIQADFRGLSAQAEVEVVENLDAHLAFHVTVPESTPASDTVYIVGNLPELGEWDPSAVPMTPPDGAAYWTFELDLLVGDVLEYKYTRGSWAQVEKDAEGGEISNRVYTVGGDALIEDTVLRWADQ